MSKKCTFMFDLFLDSFGFPETFSSHMMPEAAYQFIGNAKK